MADCRGELYRALDASIDACGGKLDDVKVLETARHFDAHHQPKTYVGAPVRFVCCPHPPEGARSCTVAADAIVSSVAGVSIHVNTEESMHVTLFHTSHPNDRRPFSDAIRAHELSDLRALAAAFPQFSLRFHSIVLASSGSIVMLFDDPDDTVDRLRLVAHSVFPALPAYQTKTIVHTTLARVLTPSMPSETLQALRAKCLEVTAQLRHDAFGIALSRLWYVEETHYFSAESGRRTSIALPPPLHGASVGVNDTSQHLRDSGATSG
ncbi:hypothetical protein, variant 1 [Aphanomyces invadans]|uniref:Uncharacterized protein n=1 Tax=Aphanomyces invadans TaxID=157072 RepID=A0A024THK1_9STRA|nr:hypothetical protein, variant 1 [Aphanomyces invadans]ETV93533.1 hypothetical protein, variant 1 [Aphanomyces invadans]|eukprot:XP_008877875.1 hypothetical protein, variant 1 [Aphanomyces invadans]